MYHHLQKQKKLFGIPTSEIELRDLLKAWAAISLAFTILLNGLQFNQSTLYTFILSAFTVGIGFLFHEMGHKLTAQYYGCWAEFRAFNFMLVLAIIFSFFGFIFAAPGAVMIQGRVLRKEYGKISMAGPLVNFVLAVIFLFLLFAPLTPFLKTMAVYGFFINTWLGLFNMIPFGNFDGKKILVWNKLVYGFMVSFAIILLVLQQILNISLV